MGGMIYNALFISYLPLVTTGIITFCHLFRLRHQTHAHAHTTHTHTHTQHTHTHTHTVRHIMRATLNATVKASMQSSNAFFINAFFITH